MTNQIEIGKRYRINSNDFSMLSEVIPLYIGEETVFVTILSFREYQSFIETTIPINKFLKEYRLWQ